jgi:hypothetical protein
MYIYTILHRMTDIMISQKSDLSSGTPCIISNGRVEEGSGRGLPEIQSWHILERPRKPGKSPVKITGYLGRPSNRAPPSNKNQEAFPQYQNPSQNQTNITKQEQENYKEIARALNVMTGKPVPP